MCSLLYSIPHPIVLPYVLRRKCGHTTTHVSSVVAVALWYSCRCRNFQWRPSVNKPKTVENVRTQMISKMLKKFRENIEDKKSVYFTNYQPSFCLSCSVLIGYCMMLKPFAVVLLSSVAVISTQIRTGLFLGPCQL